MTGLVILLATVLLCIAVGWYLDRQDLEYVRDRLRKLESRQACQCEPDGEDVQRIEIQ